MKHKNRFLEFRNVSVTLYREERKPYGFLELIITTTTFVAFGDHSVSER